MFRALCVLLASSCHSNAYANTHAEDVNIAEHAVYADFADQNPDLLPDLLEEATKATEAMGTEEEPEKPEAEEHAASDNPDTGATPQSPESPAPHFCRGYLTLTEGDSEAQALLEVPSGTLATPSTIKDKDLLDFTETDEYSSFRLSAKHGPVWISGRDKNGTFGRLHARALDFSLAELEHGGPLGSNGLQEDDVYNAYRKLLVGLSSQKKYDLRDTLLWGNKSLLILRSNGDLDIQLYHQQESPIQEQKSPLTYLGRFVARQGGDGTFIAAPDGLNFMAQRQQLNEQAEKLQQEIFELSQSVAQRIYSGAGQATPSELEQLEILNKELQASISQGVPPEHFDFYAVTESVDYASGHWLKLEGDSGLELAGQAVSFKTLSHLYDTQAEHLTAVARWQDTYTAAQELLDDAFSQLDSMTGVDRFGAQERENLYARLVRKLTASLALAAGESPHPPLAVQPNPGKPVIRTRGTNFQVLSEPSTQKSLETMRRALSMEGEPPPDAFLINEEQLDSMRRALKKTGWGAWFKSFIQPDAYEATAEAEDLRDLMRSQGCTGLNALIQSNGLRGGLPVLISSEGPDASTLISFITSATHPDLAREAELVLNDAHPQVLVIDASVLDDPTQVRTGIVRTTPLDATLQERIEREALSREARLMQGKLHAKMQGWRQAQEQGLAVKAWGTLMAAGSGMATGYAVQRGLDTIKQYYNEGVFPWSCTEKEAQEQHARALRTGGLMAISGAVNHLLLPTMRWNDGEAPHLLSPYRLRTQGIKNDFSGALAGAVSGLAARSIFSGYEYWQGDKTAYEITTELADAAARSVPTAVGSVAGHWVLPWAFDMPYLSTFLPIGYVGAVAGGLLGNLAYDTAKHYIQVGATTISNTAFSLLEHKDEL